MVTNNILALDRKINLPLVGSVALPVVLIGGLAAYFLIFKRKGKITSVTTRYRK